jgi:hypothetical protein
MLTIVWNLGVFHGINVLSKGINFNTDHYLTDALIPLAEWRKASVSRTNRNLIFHANSARPILRKLV